MHCLHRAARIANVAVVKRILEIKPELANEATYAGRSPGLATPLAVLGEADQSNMYPEDVDCCVVALMEHMDADSLGLVNNNGNTVFHQVASRGNVRCMEKILQSSISKFGGDIVVNILNKTNNKGKSVKDMAMYNAKIRKCAAQI